MQVFKAYFKIVRKKLTSVVIYFVIFIGIALALTMFGGENEVADFTQTSLAIAVENLDEGILGNALVEYLSANNEVSEIPKTEDELLDAMFSRKLDYVLYIPKDFTKRFREGDRENLLTDRKVPSSTTGMFADNQIESYLLTVGMYLDGGFALEESVDNARENLAVTAEIVFADGKKEQEKDPAVYYLQYLAYIFISTLMVLIGPLLIAFNREEISDRNKCSSMSFFNRNMQLVGASVLVVLIEYAAMMLIALWLYPDFMCSVKGILAMVNVFLMLLIAMAMAYLAAQLVKKEEALSIVSNTFGLGFSFLGGVFVPMEIFSDTLLVVSKFTPTYWYVFANDAISELQGFSEMTGKLAQSFAIEGIYAVVLLAVGLLINRMKARR